MFKMSIFHIPLQSVAGTLQMVRGYFFQFWTCQLHLTNNRVIIRYAKNMPAHKLYWNEVISLLMCLPFGKGGVNSKHSLCLMILKEGHVAF